MSVGKTALLVAIGLASVSVVLLRLNDQRIQAERPVEKVSLNASPARNPSAGLATPITPLPQAGEGQRMASGPEPAAISDIAELSIPFEPAQGTLDVLTLILDDPVFQEACAHPSEADWDSLERLIAEGRNALMAFQTEECMRRVEAGLYERVEGHVPGQALNTTTDDRHEFHSYAMENGEARRVRFPPEEYPEMHALRDQVEVLFQETRARMKAGRGGK